VEARASGAGTASARHTTAPAERPRHAGEALVDRAAKGLARRRLAHAAARHAGMPPARRRSRRLALALSTLCMMIMVASPSAARPAPGDGDRGAPAAVNATAAETPAAVSGASAPADTQVGHVVA
jgi:hypothetical protein